MTCGCDNDILSQLARATSCGQAPTLSSVATVLSTLCKECVWLVPAGTAVADFMSQVTTPANLSCDCEFYLVAVGADIANPDDMYITADTPAPADTSWMQIRSVDCMLPIASGSTPDTDGTNGIGSANYTAKVAAGCTRILFIEDDPGNAIWIHNANNVGNDAWQITGGTWDIILQDQKAPGTNGGTSTSTTTHTRVLNTEVVDVNNNCALSSNQFTLDAGTYDIVAFAVCRNAGQTKLRLRNTTAGTYLLEGLSQLVPGTGDGSYPIILNGRFTVAAGQALELHHYIQVGEASTGLGVGISQGNEIFSQVLLKKVR